MRWCAECGEVEREVCLSCDRKRVVAAQERIRAEAKAEGAAEEREAIAAHLHDRAESDPSMPVRCELRTRLAWVRARGSAPAPADDARTKVLAALKEALDLLNLCDPEGKRAKFIRAPEDAAVRELCEATGYGAVMDSAARQWRNRDALGALGAHTTGPAVGSVQRGVALVTEALAILEKP